MKKKLLTLFLALSLITGLLPRVAYAEDDIPEQNGTEETVLQENDGEETVLQEDSNQEPAVTDSVVQEPAADISAEPQAEAEEESDVSDETPYVRTIMMYICGSDLETYGGLATYNLLQIVNANFSKNNKVKYIIMTGGAWEWQTPSDILVDPNNPEQSITIDAEYNQVWEARGLDAEEYGGKMILLEEKGLHGIKAPYPEDEDEEDGGELMTDADLLIDFINYCVENYPAEIYDLILWDHGGGALGGFGSDLNDGMAGIDSLSNKQMMDVLANNAVTEDGSKFDFINYDACMMCSVEQVLAFADYMDYYIASPETVPGYGEDYTRWLNTLGQDPYYDTFELGKIIVDDFIAFYDAEEGDGAPQEGTMGVIDMAALMASDFVEILDQMADLLAKRAAELDAQQNQYLFYDEFDSNKNCIQYGNMNYYDLGVLISQLSFDFKELAEEDIVDDNTINDKNMYTEPLAKLVQILSDENIIYARGTKGIKSKTAMYRDIYGKTDYDEMETSGIYLFFLQCDTPDKAREYVDVMLPIIYRLTAKSADDPRREFLRSYCEALIDYALISRTGYVVSALLDEGMRRSEIDFAAVKNYLTNGTEDDGTDPGDPDFDNWDYFLSPWNLQIVELLEFREEVRGNTDVDARTAENNVKGWLEEIILQQAKENISREDMTLKTIKQEDGTGYRIEMENTQKRVVEDVRFVIGAHLPAIQKYLEEDEDDIAWGIPNHEMQAYAAIGSISGDLLYETADGEPVSGDNPKEYIEWYMDPSGKWELPPMEETWYVIQDAEGYLHVAQIETDENEIYFLATYESEDGEKAPVYIDFIDGELVELYFVTEGGGFRGVPISELTGEIEVMPVKTFTLFAMDFYLPLSKKPIVISPETAGSIMPVKADLNTIEDIQDYKSGTDANVPTYDEQGVSRSIVVRDIYGYEIEFSPEDAEEELIDIALAEVEPSVYNGVSQSPVVTYNGEVLTEGVDYTWEAEDDTTDVGDHAIVLKGMGKFIRECGMTFTITPADIADAVFEDIRDQEYTGDQITPALTATFNDLNLVEGKDYTVTYENNIEEGTATVTIEGIGNFTGKITMTFKITPAQEQVEPEPEPVEPEPEPVEPVEPPVETGDTNNLAMWFALLGVSVFTLLAVLIIWKRRSQ